MERLFLCYPLHEPRQVQAGCLVGQETLEKPPTRGQMAGISQRELAERFERQYGRSRAAPRATETQSLCNRGFEPLVHPSCKKTVLAREAKQRQARLLRGPSSCTENLAHTGVAVHPVLDRDSLPARLSQE